MLTDYILCNKQVIGNMQDPQKTPGSCYNLTDMAHNEEERQRLFTPAQQIDRSVFKKYKPALWGRFLESIRRYDLIQENDRIAVCISGGKDSMCMAKLFRLLQAHSEIPFEVKYLVMDPGYSDSHRAQIEKNLQLLNIPAEIFTTNIFAVAEHLNGTSPCYLCARMRRGHLYNKAKELSCNKIALGHHLNDAIETTLMSMFYSSKIETIVPKAHSENFPGMELIRPMYAVREEDILSWAAYNDLHFLQCACSFTENKDFDRGSSKRQEVKKLIKDLKKDNPEIERSLFNSLHAVQIETFPGYKAKGNLHSFLENYSERGNDFDYASVKKSSD